ncbi:MAG: formylglycine-generating enzyme family protein [Planctomycetota bacterium]|jgi:hypothetical protein
MPGSSQGAVVRDTVRAGDYEFDRAPVTNARYAAFVTATDHRAPAYWPDGACPHSLSDHPAVGIDYFDAVAYARWAGGRLPTAAEWVLAAGDERVTGFAWGDEFKTTHCNTIRSGRKGTAPVDAHPDGAAPSGAVDLCGNVWELTCSADTENDGTVIVKGGSWYDYPVHARLDASFHAPIHRVGRTVGFRLIYGGAERHPDFLDPDLLQACLEFRQTVEERESCEPIAEFDFAALREDLAHEHGGDLHALATTDEPIHYEGGDVETVQAWFDEAEHSAPAPAANDKGNRKGEPYVVLVEWYERVQTFLAAHALVVPTTLVTAFGATLLLALAVAFPALGPSRHSLAQPAVLEQPSGAATASAHTPAPTLAANASQRDLFAALGGRDQRIRFRAEEILLGRTTLPEDKIKAMLADTALAPQVRASLQYVLATGSAKRATLDDAHEVDFLPNRGLVLVFARIDGKLRREIARVRMVAQSVGIPLTLVYSGSDSANDVLESYGPMFRGTEVFVDPGAQLVGTWAQAGQPVVGRLLATSSGGVWSDQVVHRPFSRARLARLAENPAPRQFQ